MVQTWQITGPGALSGSRNATVEVVAHRRDAEGVRQLLRRVRDRQDVRGDELRWQLTIDSYDSNGLDGLHGADAVTSGGNVGTNGNLTISGSVDVQGNLYTPRTGVGACTAGAVDALTQIGHADVGGSIVQLPTAVSYPTPRVPAVSPLAATGTINGAAGACALIGLTAANCAESGNDVTVNGHGSTLSLPSVTLGSHTNMILVASSPSAQYNFNAIKLNGGSTVKISATSPTQGVIVDVVGKNPTAA